ncbi:unnamed protein product [Blepharisma stoltei]|uniref:chitin synthase n=1 Tax=Blepharisma stoltei TaxID=1481888 RepID=A0AAU9J627_9CILI|nr:unnamed protein product [Blepharisma stoltei]
MERVDSSTDASPKNFPWCDYQPLLLNKTVTNRHGKGTKVKRGLESVNGFRLIDPELKEIGILEKSKSMSPHFRGCDLLIGIFIQSEGEPDFSKTLKAVITNIEYFLENNHSVVVVAILDGLTKTVNEKSKKKISQNEVTQIGLKPYSSYFEIGKIADKFHFDTTPNENSANYISNYSGKKDEDEIAHAFMHSNWKMETNQKYPIDFIFCIKEREAGKLNSHLWFFGGFCQHINPRYVILLDAGIKPSKNSLKYLYIAMRNDENIAGCTGEMKPKASSCNKLFEYAQRSDYKFIYMFDKGLESVFGYISSLPSNFSAYRWGPLNMKILLESHFKSICNPNEIDFMNSNVYLSEDRLLSLSLFVQEDKKYILRYVKRSKATVNVSNKVYKIMIQRRRWINGTWFILLESIKKTGFVIKCKTAHSPLRRFLFLIQMFLYLTNFFFSWLIIGFFAVFLLGGTHKLNLDMYVLNILMIIYGLLLFYVLIISLGVSPRKLKKVDTSLTLVAFILFLVSVVSCVVIGIFWLRDSQGSEQVYIYSLLVVGILFILNIMFYLEVFISMFHYLALIPILVNICMIYAICNLHDCSYDPQKMTFDEEKRMRKFQTFRSFWTLIWIASNGIFTYFMFIMIEKEIGTVLITVSMIGMINLCVRFSGGLGYHIQEWLLDKKCSENYPTEINSDPPLIEPDSNLPDLDKEEDSHENDRFRISNPVAFRPSELREHQASFRNYDRI